MNKTIREIAKKFPDQLSNILLIIRKDKHFVPNSRTELLLNDDVYFVVESSQVSKAMTAFGHNEIESNNVIIFPNNSGLFKNMMP